VVLLAGIKDLPAFSQNVVLFLVGKLNPSMTSAYMR